MTDEEVLLACYRKIAECSLSKKHTASEKGDRNMISGIATQASLLLMRLSDPSIMRTSLEIQWKELPMNERLAERFLSVTVSYIPREKNRRADKLGRTRAILDIPISTYNEPVGYKKRIDELERKVKQLEATQIRDMGIAEVIVAKTVIFPDETKETAAIQV